MVRKKIGEEFIDGIKFDVYEIKTDSQTAIEKVVNDPIESTEQAKQARIHELKTLIADKKLLDMDCALEQLELKTLLGL